jgi:hypothetical protein
MKDEPGGLPHPGMLRLRTIITAGSRERLLTDIISTSGTGIDIGGMGSTGITRGGGRLGAPVTGFAGYIRSR